MFYSDFGKIEQFPSNDIAIEHIPTTRIEVEQFPSLYITVHLKSETVLQDFFAFLAHPNKRWNLFYRLEL